MIIHCWQNLLRCKLMFAKCTECNKIKLNEHLRLMFERVLQVNDFRITSQDFNLQLCS